jgi:RNA polymerase sigma factor (sigma-70 family)
MERLKRITDQPPPGIRDHRQEFRMARGGRCILLGRTIGQGGAMVMFPRQPGRVSRPIEVLWTSGTMAGLSDAQLLSRFVQTRDVTGELAFSELVQRHGPMVLGVCRQIVRHSQDADDAFQATFLILVRKAPSIRVGESLAPWLYSVACRTARRARNAAARYRPETAEPIPDREALPEENAYTRDLRPLLYEELGRLPGKYRAPIVLCHLEGKTHEEAARLLRWPVGTVSGRLSRGRRLLRSRLERRGVTVPSAILSAAWLIRSQSVLTTPLVEHTVTAATGFAAASIPTVSASVLSLTQGVLKTMLLRKLGTITLAVLLLGAVSGGAGVWAHWTTALPQHAAPAAVSTQTQTPEASPAPRPNPAPQTQPQPSADSQPMVADNGPSDCPLTGADSPRTYCPISMAAHALARMFGHPHEQTVSSR